MYGEKIELAVRFATLKHQHQIRKLTETPYIFHPVEVGIIASSLTTDEDTICAAILHDTVEDTDATLEIVEAQFGARVRELVAGDTENKRADRPASETWKIRKQESLNHLKNCNDTSVKIIWLSDKLSNIRSMFNAHLSMGDELWTHFHMKDKKEHEWYYKTAAEYLSDLKNTGPYREYVMLVDKIFEEE